MPRRRSGLPLTAALLLTAALAAAALSGGAAHAAPAAHTAPAASAAPAAAGRTGASLPAVIGPAVAHRFPIRGCRFSYARTHHDYPATDIFAARGCPVVAVTAGRVDEVSWQDRWSPVTNRGADRGGLSVSVVGRDGVRYYGSHLSRIAPSIRPGTSVVAGQLLGYVGNTGSARPTATHLHFGVSWPTPPNVWWVRRGMVWPWRYLDSWRLGGNLSPAQEVAYVRSRTGTVPPCRVAC